MLQALGQFNRFSTSGTPDEEFPKDSNNGKTVRSANTSSS